MGKGERGLGYTGRVQQSLLQSDPWASFKRRQGWRDHNLGGVHLLERRLPGNFPFIYAPELSIKSDRDTQKLARAARELGQSRQAFAVRLEFFEEWTDRRARELKKLDLKKAFEEIQPEWRQWIDLKASEDKILAQMKPKGRYNIRLASRHGVIIQPQHDVKTFYRLLSETARRDRFAIREIGYFADLLNFLLDQELGELLIAYYRNQPLSALIASYYHRFASYLYGASSDGHRELMAPYLLHWETIKRAQARGCTTYDLLAVAPLQTTNYKLQTKYLGLSRFKQQFGGRTVHLLGSWDLVLNPVIYQLFKAAELLRRNV